MIVTSRLLAPDRVTREFIVKQLANYTKALAQEGAKLKNAQLVPRKELMEKILKVWK